ncbi:hypothetical protein [[Limnothrix rosea] IAM M-220]|uniref:hypothetical protein n=1 Tax=[Limnothrix rosea] IAM M-220 TaxID=454133 RepID=UPI0009668F72|nr:hypothetical protein [[Limnothrix rosea] IAM M-220]OKH19197.1 hypothetical protein NIES208_02805 [[Limnothrix rosea] IAM M-220]
MIIQAAPKFWLVTTLFATGMVFSLSPSEAIAQKTETIMWPTQITNEFTPIRFTSNPYADVQALTLSDDEKIDVEFRPVQDEATADAPQSESHNSGFKIRFGLRDPNTSTTEAE